MPSSSSAGCACPTAYPVQSSLAWPGLGLGAILPIIGQSSVYSTLTNSTHLQDVLQIAPSVHHLTAFLGRAVKREYLLSSSFSFLPSF